jgi:hypothetical protein
MNINIFLIVFIGMIVGALSGLFGVGGGFLMTPLLIFLGIPPVVAVGSEAPHVLASSVSGVIAHWRKKNVDFKMGFFLLSGGVVGSTVGVNLFKLLNTYGQIDIVIQFLFIIFLGFIGISMAFESAKTTIKNYRTTSAIRTKLHQHSWIHGLPFKLRFHRSKLYISAIPPILIGFFCRHTLCNDGRWWWLYNDTSNGLHTRNVYKCCCRHFIVSNYFCNSKFNFLSILLKSNCRYSSLCSYDTWRSNWCTNRSKTWLSTQSRIFKRNFGNSSFTRLCKNSYRFSSYTI